ncbi:unnamed protein product, partial [marine sediment metagenome]
DSVNYLKERFPWVELIENHKNLGFAQGNNVGIKYALEKGADYILILNNDTIVSTSLLRDLLDVVSKDRTIGIAGPKVLYYHKKDRIWFAGGKVSLLLGNTWHIGNRRRDGQKSQNIIEEDYQTGCALLIRRETVNKIGMFDPQYFAYFEDTDLCLRARNNGFRVVCVQDAKIWHKVSGTTGRGLTSKKAYLKAKSGVKFFKKYSPRLFYYTTVPISILGYIILRSVIERLKKKRGIFNAFIKGLRDGRNLISER